MDCRHNTLTVLSFPELELRGLLSQDGGASRFEVGGRLSLSSNPASRLTEKEVAIRMERERLLAARTLGRLPSRRRMASRLISAISDIRLIRESVSKFGMSTGFVFREASVDFSFGRPKSRSIKLLHISDVHIDLENPEERTAKNKLSGAIRSFLGRLKVEGNLCADLAVITGDIQDRYLQPFSLSREAFAHAFEPLDCPIVGVLGNHDTLELLDSDNTSFLRRAFRGGFEMLVNHSLILTSQGRDVLEIRGVDDPQYYRLHRLEPACGAGTPKVLLAHSPVVAEEAETHGYNLCLCGHTHGGQVNLPFFHSYKLVSRVPHSRSRGWWAHRGMIGHTSHGIGCSALPLRLGAPPEVTMITIVLGDG